MELSSVEGSSPVLDLESVTVILGGEKVVNSVSLSVESGEWLSIIGPNGSGKSSLLRAIAGLVSSTGNIVFDGIDLSELAPKERAQTISIVPQIPVVPPRVKSLITSFGEDPIPRKGIPANQRRFNVCTVCRGKPGFRKCC